MTKKANNTAVAVKSGGSAIVHDYGEQAGAGWEGTSGADLSVPFIGILQANSPQVTDEDPPGAASGMLFNTVTREIFRGDEGVVFLPCHKEVAYVEWVPRDNGGGFVGLHAPDSKVVEEAIANNDGRRVGKLQTEGNDLIETHYIYGLLLDEEGTTPQGFAVISFTSTKIKPCRDWITAMYTLRGRPPMFANRARIKTVKQKNDHGTFFNFRIEPLRDSWATSLIDPKSEANLLEEATSFRDMVVKGMAKAAFETERAAGSDEAASEEAPF